MDSRYKVRLKKKLILGCAVSVFFILPIPGFLLACERRLVPRNQAKGHPEIQGLPLDSRLLEYFLREDWELSASIKKMNAFLACVTRWMLALFWDFGALQQSGKLMLMAFQRKIVKNVRLFRQFSATSR